MTNIKTVAQLAGVSASTVSRVLSGKTKVNDETRARVMEAIQATNYSPNVLAKSLKMGTSKTIALIVPSIQNLIFPQITRGVEDTARKNGYTVILCNTDEDSEIERSYIQKLQTRWIDGFIAASMEPDSEHLRELARQGEPLVLVNRYIPGDEMDVVTTNNQEAAYQAVQYLIRSGHKRIAIALGREELIFYSERFLGYRRALADAGIPFEECLVMHETSGNESFYQLTKELMQSGANPDAVFATSDPKAFAVLHGLHDLGVKIPEQVSVMGFDNVEMSAMMQPPLSTIAQPLYEMGVTATQKLLRQIKYKETHGTLPPPTTEVLHNELIIRRSTR